MKKKKKKIQKMKLAIHTLQEKTILEFEETHI